MSAIPFNDVVAFLYRESRLLDDEAWDEWLDTANMPARATVEARLASPDYKVEIAAIAAR